MEKTIAVQPTASEKENTKLKQQVAVKGKDISAIAISMAFGVFLLAGVGFAQPAFLHDAAHDTRHAIGFPCH